MGKWYIKNNKYNQLVAFYWHNFALFFSSNNHPFQPDFWADHGSGLFAIPIFKKYPFSNPHASWNFNASRHFFTRLFRRTLLDPIRFSSEPPWFIQKLSRFSLRCSMLSWPLCPHSSMIKLEKINLRRYKTTMKTSNHFAKLPQEASITGIRTFRTRVVWSLKFGKLSTQYGPIPEFLSYLIYYTL